MRRPIRTRRLSIAGILSLLAFVNVAVVGAKSFWIGEGRGSSSNFDGWFITLRNGCVTCRHLVSSTGSIPLYRLVEHHQGDVSSFPFPEGPHKSVLGFTFYYAHRSPPTPFSKEFCLTVPLWLPLLLLLIAPVRYLVALPANTTAFPVIADAEKK